MRKQQTNQTQNKYKEINNKCKSISQLNERQK